MTVIHKAMAKQPWHRFASAREILADALQKALRNEPLEFFNPARIQPRIERASKAFETGDLQFAGEILTELEAEGHIDPAMTTMRRQIEQAIRSHRSANCSKARARDSSKTSTRSRFTRSRKSYRSTPGTRRRSD